MKHGATHSCLVGSFRAYHLVLMVSGFLCTQSSFVRTVFTAACTVSPNNPVLYEPPQELQIWTLKPRRCYSDTSSDFVFHVRSKPQQALFIPDQQMPRCPTPTGLLGLSLPWGRVGILRGRRLVRLSPRSGEACTRCQHQAAPNRQMKHLMRSLACCLSEEHMPCSFPSLHAQVNDQIPLQPCASVLQNCDVSILTLQVA